MTSAQSLVVDLEAKGVRLAWGSRGATLLGDVSRVTPEMLQEMKAHRTEIESFALWRHLQDESEAKFGHAAARVYPFTRLKPMEGDEIPTVATPIGEARVVAIVGNKVEVIMESDVQSYRAGLARDEKTLPPPVHRFPPQDIQPPTKPPPPWQVMDRGHD